MPRNPSSDSKRFGIVEFRLRAAAPTYIRSVVGPVEGGVYRTRPGLRSAEGKAPASLETRFCYYEA